MKYILHICCENIHGQVATRWQLGERVPLLYKQGYTFTRSLSQGDRHAVRHIRWLEHTEGTHDTLTHESCSGTFPGTLSPQRPRTHSQDHRVLIQASNNTATERQFTIYVLSSFAATSVPVSLSHSLTSICLLVHWPPLSKTCLNVVGSSWNLEGYSVEPLSCLQRFFFSLQRWLSVMFTGYAYLNVVGSSWNLEGVLSGIPFVSFPATPGTLLVIC